MLVFKVKFLPLTLFSSKRSRREYWAPSKASRAIRSIGTLLEDEPLNLSLLRHCSLPHSTYFPFTTTTNFPFELLNSTYLLTKYLYVYLFSCRTIKIELFPSKYLLRSVRIRTVFRARTCHPNTSTITLTILLPSGKTCLQ